MLQSKEGTHKMSIICIKHKIKFKTVCPECEKLKQTISINHISSNPVHNSKYNMDYLNVQLDNLNNKIKRLLKDNE